MKDSTVKTGVQILVHSLLKHGVTDIVFSPGSRNAPLVVGIVGSGKFKTISLPDERSAAFFALGIAQQTGRPVPVICTSGSALLNYAPAVAEAFYQRIHFLVISADRPLEWIDQGVGQTIRQAGVYSNFIEYQVSLPVEPATETQEWLYHREVETAVNLSVKGPVHINIPFEEPLYAQKVETIRERESIHFPEVKKYLSDAVISSLREQWKQAKRKMIIVGQQDRDPRFITLLDALLNDDDTAVLVENTSNIVHQRAVHCIDRTLAIIEAEKEEYLPDLLITFGGAVVSKKIKAFLRSANLKHWRIGEDMPFMATYKHLTQSIPVSPVDFLEQFTAGLEVKATSGFGNKWKTADYKAIDLHHAYLHDLSFCDLKVMEIVHDSIPEKSVLHLGNSSVVRYAQLFDPLRFVTYRSNRGTSGIDGCVSTAAGAAYADTKSAHTLVVGDISFFYDSNALWNQFLTTNLRIIVIHNGGGGIFRIIPGPDTTAQLDDYFVTQHAYSAEYICKAFDITYLSASSEEELELNIAELYRPVENNRPVLLEVFTPGTVNDKYLKEYFKTLGNG